MDRNSLDALSPFQRNWSPSTPDEKDWVSKKIAILVREGYPQAQAVAIAHSMAAEHFSKGGPGSGFHGHSGRPGERGGSASSGGAGGETPGQRRMRELYANPKEVFEVQSLGVRLKPGESRVSANLDGKKVSGILTAVWRDAEEELNFEIRDSAGNLHHFHEPQFVSASKLTG